MVGRAVYEFHVDDRPWPDEFRIIQGSRIKRRNRDRVAHGRLQLARQQVCDAGEDAAGFGKTDILRHGFHRNVEQRVAGMVTTIHRQVFDRIGDHRSAATREAVGAMMTASDAANGPSQSTCANAHRARRMASSRLMAEQVGRCIASRRLAPKKKASMAMAKSGSAPIRPAILKPRYRAEPSRGKARSTCHWRSAHKTKRSPIGRLQAQSGRPQLELRSTDLSLSA